MKTLITRLLLLSMLTLPGCTKTIYTNDQVIDRYKTKQNVLNGFGIPTEKQVSDTSEKWLYRYDRHDSFNQHSVELHHNTQTITVNDFSRYNRYLIFSFDEKGTVIRADYTGVDLAVKKADAGGTIALVAIGVAAVGMAIFAITQMSFGGSAGY